MKKIVSESVYEFRKHKALNEQSGFFGRAISSVKKLFQRVGKFFFFQPADGQTESIILPINIGIMTKNKMLPDYISYVASKEDIALDPGLTSESDAKLIAKYKAMEKDAPRVNEARVPLKNPNTNMTNVDRTSLYRMIRIALKNPAEPPMLIWGAPGIGKTQIVQELVKAKGFGKLVDVQTSKMAPDDWALPYVLTRAAGEVFDINLPGGGPGSSGPQAIDIPKSWLPVYIPTGDPERDKKLDEGLGQGVLFLDEISRASPPVQATCLKLVNQRIIGDAKIGSQWVIISAANRMVDDPTTLPEWSPALGNRFQNVNYVPKYEEWKEWAVGKVDERLLDFLEFHRDFFFTLDDETTGDSPFASPRTWEAASDAIKSLEEDAREEGYRVTASIIEEVVGANVGTEVALEVGKFFRIMETFSKADIKHIFQSPEKAPLPKKAGSGYDLSEGAAFLSLAISSTKGRELKAEELENFVKYIIRLGEGSLATNAIKRIFAAHPYMHQELGEVGEPGEQDKYKKAMDMFEEKYGDLF